MTSFRRTFLNYTGGTALTLFAYSKLGGLRQAIAAIRGGTLDPLNVPKYVTPMLVPPQMPRAAILLSQKKLVDYYEIAVRQFQQQILPATLPATTVWGYGPAKAISPKAPMIFNAPSLTIEANYGRPVRIKWINELKDAHDNYLPHLLPVDPTLHWANPPQGTNPEVNGSGTRDSRPNFTATPSRYTGPVPMVTHVHGAVGVSDESDGYAEAWYLPVAKNIPGGYAKVGTWYEFFKGKAAANYGATWGPGFATFQYPNSQRASTVWYHDHTLGMTRLNVYAGPAGFFIVRGGPAGDLALRDTRTGRLALLPRPAPSEIDQIQPNRKFYEIPIAIQDRSFNNNGSLFYPDSRAFFGDVAPNGPITSFIPTSDVSPIANPEFFGNMIMVNGNTWPYLEVEQRRYRLRFLNGCDSRFLILDFANIPGVEVWMVGNEGGFLAAPVNMTAVNGSRILMSPAERADVIVDFTNVAAGSYTLGNVGPDAPFGGFPIPTGDLADAETTGQVMQFRVVPALAADPTTPPQFLQLPAIPALPAAKRTRKLVLAELTSNQGWDVPVETRLGTAEDNGNYKVLKWEDPVTETENPGVGDSEIWEFYNTTVDAHPMHIHEVAFEVLNRQGIRGVRPEHRGGDRQRAVGWLGARPAALGARPQGHRDRVSRRGHAREGDLLHARAVRLALPHRRT